MAESVYVQPINVDEAYLVLSTYYDNASYDPDKTTDIASIHWEATPVQKSVDDSSITTGCMVTLTIGEPLGKSFEVVCSELIKSNLPAACLFQFYCPFREDLPMSKHDLPLDRIRGASVTAFIKVVDFAKLFPRPEIGHAIEQMLLLEESPPGSEEGEE